MMHSTKKKYSIWMLLAFLFFQLNMIAQDDFDPLLPDESDPGNVPINDFLLLLFIVGVMYAFYRLASTKREFTSN